MTALDDGILPPPTGRRCELQVIFNDTISRGPQKSFIAFLESNTRVLAFNVGISIQF